MYKIIYLLVDIFILYKNNLLSLCFIYNNFRNRIIK